MSNSETEMVSFREALKLSGLSHPTLRKYLRDGKLNAQKDSTGAWKISRADCLVCASPARLLGVTAKYETPTLQLSKLAYGQITMLARARGIEPEALVSEWATAEYSKLSHPKMESEGGNDEYETIDID